jgi:hypothetical protein
LVPPRDGASSAPTEKASGRAKSQGEPPKTAYTGTTSGNSWQEDDAASVGRCSSEAEADHLRRLRGIS